MSKEILYDFHKLDELRDDYRHLYHQIREYLSTLNSDEHWALEYGVFPESDSSIVVMFFRSMKKPSLLLSVRGEQKGADYSFTSHQTDETN